MTSLDLIRQQIDEGLRTGQIGTPVSLRILAYLEETGTEDQQLDQWARKQACRWLQAAPLRTQTVTSADSPEATHLVLFDQGQSALVSTGPPAAADELLQITIYGTQGTLVWEGPGRKSTLRLTAKDSDSARVREPQSPPYGVLLVSGHHTHQPMYAAAFRDDSRCRLIGLTDEQNLPPQRERWNRQLAVELGIPYLDDFRQAVARSDVDIVSICAEPMRRGPLIALAAQSEKHLYLDKPLAASSEDLQAIKTAVSQSNVLAHMFSSLTAAPMARLDEILKSGSLGRLRAVHFDLCFAKGAAGSANLGQPRQERFPPTRFELPDAKRELTNVGVYPLVLLAASFQRPVRRIAAITGNYFFAEHQQRDMEDFGQLWIEMDGSLVATCSAGRTGWRSHAADGLNRVTLVGSRAALVIDAHWPRVEIWSEAPDWRPPPVNPDDPMGMWLTPPDSKYRPEPKHTWLMSPTLSPAADVDYFLACLEAGRDSRAGIEAAGTASAILWAAYQSAASGQIVEF
jgi:predicted dehydrogenase